MTLEYTLQIWREEGQFIAHAMPLDVASSGSSPDEARRAVDEAVRLFLSTAEEHGTLEQVLEDAGYAHVGNRWESPGWMSIERAEAVVPA